MWGLILLAAVASAALIPTEQASPITVPLTKVKRDASLSDSQLASRSVPLKSFADILYYGNGTVRNMTFQFLFDTGSSDVVLPGPECPWMFCGPNEKYDEAGKNLSKTVEMQYASGKIVGGLFQDSVTVDGKTVHGQVLVSAVVNELLSHSDANGVIGLAFSGVSKTNGTTFFDNLMKQATLPSPEIGMYVGRLDNGPKGQGELTIGGRNQKHFQGPVKNLPVIEEFYWTVAVDEVRVKGKCVGDATRNNSAAIDSGTQAVIAPKAAAAELFAAIPGARIYKNQSEGGKNDDFTYYLLPCNTTQKYMPSLVMGGQPFEILAEDLMIPSGDEPGMCESQLWGSNLSSPKTKNLWIVGDVFLRNWYVIYNHGGTHGKPYVGLARAKK